MDATIMVVNISPAFGKILKKFFMDQGFNVLVAKDGLEAFRLFIQHQVDLVLCDYHLPEISGADVARTFRSNDSHRHLPIVVFTSSADGDVASDCEDAGVTLVLDKNMDHGELIAAVRQLVDDYKDSLMATGLDQDLALSTTTATTEVMQTMMNMEVTPVNSSFAKVQPQEAEVIGSVGVAGVLSGCGGGPSASMVTGWSSSRAQKGRSR